MAANNGSSATNSSVKLSVSSSLLTGSLSASQHSSFPSTLSNPFGPGGASDFTANYELAYHHHLQTALQMGQFYNPELSHHSAAAAAAAAAAMAIRGSSSGGSGAMSGTGGGLSSGVGHPGGNSGGGSGAGGNSGAISVWGDGSQRSTPLGYHHNHNHLSHQGPDLLSASSSIPCDIWPAVGSNSRSGNGMGQR